ncbi:MAG TPA: pyrroline-5-carboxylate reductase dimerization domain-containing protein [Terriglobales bacterium]|nr:pyrroline-5-carboxylate reductase dimerization domain-containing protein [Terriglobales bacterium]
MKAIVFVGGGRITSALLAGLRLAKYSVPLLVHDHHPRKLRQLNKLYGVKTEENLQRAIAQARILVVAVRPASISGLLREVSPVARTLPAVSLAAGIPLATLRKRLPVRWARAMPSPTCRSGRGLTALTFAGDFPATAKREVRKLFAKGGEILEIPERKFDVFTVTYSCSHGYHALAALADSAEKLGLDKKLALTAAAHALADGIVAWRDGHISLERLLHEAATPGGIAAGVMESMKRAGYKKVVLRGLAAGLSRARQNSKLI